MHRGTRRMYLRASLCCAVTIGAVMCLLISWALPAAAPQDRVNAAYAAMGGDKLKTLSLKASLEQFDPGESYSFSDPTTPGVGASEMTLSRDLARGIARIEWVRPKADDGTKRTFTEIVTPTAGYVIGN